MGEPRQVYLIHRCWLPNEAFASSSIPFTHNSLTSEFSLVLGSTDGLGTCWMQVNSGGTCNFPWETGITREDCCRLGRLGIGWSSHRNISSSQIFYWRLLSHELPSCQPCHGKVKTGCLFSTAASFSLHSPSRVILSWICQNAVSFSD